MRRENLTRARRALAALDVQQRQQVRQGLGWFLENAAHARQHVDRSTPSGRAWFAAFGHPREDVRRFIATVRKRTEPEDLRAALRGLVGAAFAMREPVGK